MILSICVLIRYRSISWVDGTIHELNKIVTLRCLSQFPIFCELFNVDELFLAYFSDQIPLGDDQECKCVSGRALDTTSNYFSTSSTKNHSNAIVDIKKYWNDCWCVCQDFPMKPFLLQFCSYLVLWPSSNFLCTLCFKTVFSCKP